MSNIKLPRTLKDVPLELIQAAQKDETARAELRALLTQHLGLRARQAIISAIGNVLESGDLIVLCGLGVDGKKELLEIFITVCNELKKERS